MEIPFFPWKKEKICSVKHINAERNKDYSRITKQFSTILI